MGPNDLNSLRDNAQSAGDQASSTEQSIPGLLSGLKTNLSSIFTKDNPMFASRENALQTFLNSPSQTRADLLPANQPLFGGSHLNYSPTQQDAIVNANRNAALVPLAGLNQSIVSQSGNYNDLLGSAANLFQSQVQAAKDKAANALGLYQTGISEYNALHPNTGGSVGMGDISAILAALAGNNQPGPGKPDISTFNHPSGPSAFDTISARGQATHPVTVPGMSGTLNLADVAPPVDNNPAPQHGLLDWFHPLSWLKGLFGDNSPTTNFSTAPSQSLNLLGAGASTGPFSQ